MKKVLIILAILFFGINYCSEVHKENKEANERLWDGIMERDLKKVKDALNDKADINALDKYGFTPLLMSLHYVNSYHDYESAAEIAKFLITSNANINEADPQGNTPLLYLATCDKDVCLELVNLLIQHKANIGQKNNYGYNALFRNINNGTLPIFKKLIKVTKDINEKIKGDTPLTHIGKKIIERIANARTMVYVDQLIEMMTLLLKNGADPEIPNDEGKNLLDFLHIPKIKEALDKHKKDVCSALQTHLTPNVSDLVAEYCALTTATARG